MVEQNYLSVIVKQINATCRGPSGKIHLVFFQTTKMPLVNRHYLSLSDLHWKVSTSAIDVLICLHSVSKSYLIGKETVPTLGRGKAGSCVGRQKSRGRHFHTKMCLAV